MTITVGRASKREYAILRSTHSYTSTDMRTTTFPRYRLIEVHAATRAGQVKRYRDYGRTGNPYTETQVRRAPGTIFALGDVWVKPTRANFDTMEAILVALGVHILIPLINLDRETQ